MIPQPGAVYHLGPDCGVQWRIRPIYFRVIRVQPGPTWEGCAFLEGYEVNDSGDAVARRVAYVILAGLVLVQAPATAAPAARRPVNRSPSIPQQRTAGTARTTARSPR